MTKEEYKAQHDMLTATLSGETLQAAQSALWREYSGPPRPELYIEDLDKRIAALEEA